jgi:hypothetical protein
VVSPRESLATSAWSPDRSKLVYTAAVDRQIEIMVRELDFRNDAIGDVNDLVIFRPR